MSKDLVSKKVEGAVSALERARAAIARSAESKTVRKTFEEARTQANNIKIGIIIDATASRHDSWKAATEAQTSTSGKLSAMATNVNVGLYFHSGGKAQSLGWFADGQQAKHAMSGITCKSGSTQIEGCLGLIDADTKSERPDVIVVVGDCFEDNLNNTIEKAKALGVPVFGFFENTKSSSPSDRAAFEKLCLETGGACVELGSDPDAISEYIRTAIAIKRGGSDLKAVTGSPAYLALTSANPNILKLTKQP